MPEPQMTTHYYHIGYVTYVENNSVFLLLIYC